MSNLVQRMTHWFKAEPIVKPRDVIVPPPVTIASVSPAPPPNEEMAIETENARVELVHALLKLGRRDNDLRLATASLALMNMTGGKPT